jgi:hypothetical protein
MTMSNTPQQRHLAHMAAIAAMSGGIGVFDAGPSRRFASKSSKKCLNCGNEHFHNNSYCSAECCKAHTAELREKRKAEQAARPKKPRKKRKKNR